MGRSEGVGVTDLFTPLIEALARQDVEDYLRQQAANEAAPGEDRPQPVALPAVDEAA